MRFASLLLLSSTLLYGSGYFEPNRGQSAANAPFLARTRSGVASIEPGRVLLRSATGARIEVGLESADVNAGGSGIDRIPGVSHYALKPNPESWIYGVPHYNAVQFRHVYPGVDLRYHLTGDNIEFDLDAVKSSDISRIVFRFSEDVQIAANGDLVLQTGRVHRPVAWQSIAGERRYVNASFHRVTRRLVSVRLGQHNPRVPITIDPIVDFATFLGGSSQETDTQMIVDAAGNIYMAGSTTSVDFPASMPPGSILNAPITLRDPDLYITRLKPDGSAIDWSFFIGGTASQRCAGLAQDSIGNIFLFGTTTSANFPVTPGAWHQYIDASLTDEVAVKLDAQTGLVRASTYLRFRVITNVPGGGFAVDTSGGVYAAGVVGANFQPTPGAYLTQTAASPGGDNAVGIVHLSADLSSAQYATWIQMGIPSVLAADANGNLIFSGQSFLSSPSFPFPAVNPISGMNQSPNFSEQSFIAKLNASGTALVYASMLNGNGRLSAITDLQVDNMGNAWVAGYTDGAGFPQVNPLLLDPVPPGVGTASPFFAEVPPQAGSLLQSTLFGPTYIAINGRDLPWIKLVKPAGRLCIAGIGLANQTPGGLGGSFSYGTSSDLSCVDDTGTTLGLKTALSETGGSYLAAQATPDGAILFAGVAGQIFATTPGVVQPAFAGTVPSGLAGGDAFLMRVSLSNPVPQIATVDPASVFVGSPNSSGTWSFNLIGTGFAYGTQITWNGQPVASTFNSSNQISVTGLPAANVVPGVNQIGASLVGPGGGTSNPISVGGYNRAPGVLSVSPSMVTAGSPQANVLISGTGLSISSILTWNGAVRATTLASGPTTGSANRLQISLDPSELLQPGVSTLAVSNPGPGGGTSPVAQFFVQPVSAPGAPVLTGPLFANETSTASTVSLTGSGFTASSVAFWDGTAVPSTLVSSTKLTITPPPGGLAQLGVHSVYVANGSLPSATIPLLVGPAINAANWVYDPTAELLYVLTGASYPAYDLSIYDTVTGHQVNNLPSIIAYPTAIALSDDGSYVYIGGGLAGLEMERFNVGQAAVDLDWQVPDNTRSAGNRIEALATVTGAPQTVIVETVGQTVIYDKDQPRPSTAGGGFSTFVPFATANRVFIVIPGSYPCLSWLDFDAAGFDRGPGASQCGLNPPELVRDHGFAYLTDGARTLTVSVPPGLAAATQAASVWQLDLSRRLAYGVAGANSDQVLQVNLNTLEQSVRLHSTVTEFGPPSIYVEKDGSLRLVNSTALLPIP